MSAADKEITQGWMPSQLPPSTRDIRIFHHLDTGQAEGSFEFAPQDWSYFTALGFSQSPDNVSATSPRRHFVTEGYSFRGYSNQGYTGMLAVHPSGRGYFWTPEYD